MERVSMCFLTVIIMMENGLTINRMALDIFIEMTVVVTKGNGKMEKGTVTELTSIRIKEGMRVNMKMIRSTDMEYFHIMMEEYMKGHGLKEHKLVRLSILTNLVKSK